MPTSGECSGCLRAPVPRLRFNIWLEDVASRRKLTQLMCIDCASTLMLRLIDKSVERTPQHELDDLRAGVSLG